MLGGDGVSEGREVVQLTYVKNPKWVSGPAYKGRSLVVFAIVSIPPVLTDRGSKPFVIAIVPQCCECDASGTFGCSPQFGGVIRLVRAC